jgi:biopolymer transport protein ExbD
MRVQKSKKVEELELQMTPMIDVIFQLLLFFLLSAKFISLEGQLSAWLPKERGDEATPEPIDPSEVILFLSWHPDEQRVECLTWESGGKEILFRNLDGRQALVKYGPPGKEKQIRYGYQVPDFDEIENFLRRRHQTYTGGSKGVPVTINAAKEVPTQMVTNLLDICTRIGITNVAIAAKEKPIE